MSEKLNVENLELFDCPECGHHTIGVKQNPRMYCIVCGNWFNIVEETRFEKTLKMEK